MRPVNKNVEIIFHKSILFHLYIVEFFLNEPDPLHWLKLKICETLRRSLSVVEECG
jgi:hypothetical protein